MLLYVWSREYPNASINLYGLVTLKVLYFLVWVSRRQLFLVSSFILGFVTFFFGLGILLALGNALFRYHLWFSNCARSFGYYCWASLLLPYCASSACWWEEYTEDTNFDVSFSCCLYSSTQKHVLVPAQASHNRLHQVKNHFPMCYVSTYY